MSQIYECLTAFQSLCYTSWAILRPAGFAFVLEELRLVKHTAVGSCPGLHGAVSSPFRGWKEHAGQGNLIWVLKNE